MTDDQETYSFGPYRLFPIKRLLLRHGEEVKLGGRSFDLLHALISQSGQVVTQRDLIERAWPNMYVEEANLRVHIAKLRSTLEDGDGEERYIETIPRRGYCFVGNVQRNAGQVPQRTSSETAARPRSHNRLPSPLGRMIGRQETVQELSRLLAETRFVSIVGAGGIGKTTVAVSTAHSLRSEFRDGVEFIDLSGISKDELVETAITSAIKLPQNSESTSQDLLQALAKLQVLLLIDNCEHLLEAVSALAEQIHANAPDVTILTTTREALRAEGEQVYWLPVLESPPDEFITASDIHNWSAVQLFMERAAASGYRKKLSDDEAITVARICRHLDGIALAIELAASRVPSYGIDGIAELLDDHLKLLWPGRRQAPARHQTLHAVLEWSFNLLTEDERRLLTTLSVFVGNFTLADAHKIVAGDVQDANAIALTLEALADKSLLWTSIVGREVNYRLLDMARSYAKAALNASGDADEIARRHSLFVLGKLRNTATAELATPNLLGNLRAAFEWCSNAEDEGQLTADLVANSVRLLLSLSLLRECEQWCTRALEGMPQEFVDTEIELALWEGVAGARMFTSGNDPEVRRAIDRSLTIARSLGNKEHEMRLLAGLHIFLSRRADFRSMLSMSGRTISVAKEIGTDDALIAADWMSGTTYHLCGNQLLARQHFNLALERSARSGTRHIDTLGYDERGRGMIAFIRTLWILGEFELSARTAVMAIEEARALSQPVALCIAFIYTTTAAIWGDEIASIEERVAELHELAAKNSLEPYRAVAIGLRGCVSVRRGQFKDGIEDLRASLAILERENHRVIFTDLQRQLAEAIALEGGNHAEATALLDSAFAMADANGEEYLLPELFRTRGILLSTGAQSDPVAAEAAMREGIEIARRHSCTGWELRGTVSLALFLLQQSRPKEAEASLIEVLAKIEESDRHSLPSAARSLLEEARARL
ncbi:Regulatory protein AfsR [Hartmannibacter diazotrophicus]|uniref:Regulatory protein AfsR n=1 Tax=Hartmannibacter diazotrophicus TaxID=1482074 RepID=A0A2C9D1H8_9HYPH|nr:winged helix-turn-helix domain-containing protein [Hartmannibacter diazotrophicus]SON54039.1 Regulatory protein AfsR [Hartmannibacter diazotrophicus]